MTFPWKKFNDLLDAHRKGEGREDEFTEFINTDLEYPGVNVNEVNPDDEHKRTPLHDAAEAGDVELVQVLLDKGADPSATAGGDFEGQTPADIAKGDEVKALLESKGGRRRRSRLNVKRRGTKRNGRSRKHRKLRKLTSRRR